MIVEKVGGGGGEGVDLQLGGERAKAIEEEESQRKSY
jgi:hypothetical protein